MIQVKKIITLCMLLGLVVGCNKDNSGESNSESDSAPLTGLAAEAAEKAKAENEAAAAKAKAAAKKIADAAKISTALKIPLSEYRQLENAEQAAFLYYAVTKLPIDYDAIARIVSNKYSYSNDGFEKKEILDSLKPAIDEKINAYKANPIAYIRAQSSLSAFDFDRKGFAIGAVEAGSYYNFGGYNVQLKNSEQLNFIAVNDDAVARELESMRAGYNNRPLAKIYFIADGTDLDGTTINAFITRIEIIDKSGRVFATTQTPVN